MFYINIIENMKTNSCVLSQFFSMCQDEEKCFDAYKQKGYSQIQIEQKEKSLIQYLLNSLYQMLSPQYQQDFLQTIQKPQIVQIPINQQPKINNHEQFLQDSLLASTDQNKEQLKDWIKTNIRKTKLLYRGSRDGFFTDQFYQRCSEQGPTLTLIKSKEGQKIFGGFTYLSWTIPNGCWISKTDLGAFVFSLSHGTKHELYAEQSNSICMFKGTEQWAPCFGGKGNWIYDIIISDKCNENALSQSDLGKNYKLPQGFNMEMGKTYLAGSHKYTVEEIEDIYILLYINKNIFFKILSKFSNYCYQHNGQQQITMGTLLCFIIICEMIIKIKGF
ncbi:hypothetical protein pb186bvf_003468 [Paramecium bursaria]